MARLNRYFILLIYIIIVLLPIIWLLLYIILNGYLCQIRLDLRQAILLRNSLSIALGSSFLALILGVPLAFFLGRVVLPWKKIFSWAYLIPLLIPPYIQAIVWIHILGENGLFNIFLKNIFHLPKGIFTPYGIGGCILVLGISYFPIVTLLVLSGLSSLDRRFEDAGRLTHPWKSVIMRITWPLLRPHLLGGFLLVFIFCISNYAVPSLLRVNTYPVEIFIQFGAFYDYGAAFAGVFPLVIVTLVLLVAHRLIMGKRSYVVIGGRSKRAELLDSGRLKGWVFSYCLLLIVITAILPLIILTVRAGSIQSFRIAFKTSGGTILFTLWLAALAATFITILSAFVGHIIVRGKGKTGYLADLGSFLPFAIPATVFGVGLILVWNRPLTQLIYTGLGILLIAYIARFTSFSIRVMVAQFRQLNPALEEAASLYPVGKWKRWQRIELPLLKRGFLIAWLVGFILCMRELGATLLVIPPGKETVSLRIYNLMHYGAEKLVSALCLIIIAASLVPILIFLYGLSKSSMLKKTSI